MPKKTEAETPDNLTTWNKLAKPPEWALKRIDGGRLKGMTDIKPQWRYEALTEAFGPCGVGWKYEVTNKWTYEAADGQVFAFADVNLYITSEAGVWSEPIPGTGGSFLIEKEKAGLHCSDEGFKMAVTDALSTAGQKLGLGAEIYKGNWDGSKYKNEEPPAPEYIDDKQHKHLEALIVQKGSDREKVREVVAKQRGDHPVDIHLHELTVAEFNALVKALKKKPDVPKADPVEEAKASFGAEEIDEQDMFPPEED